MCLTGGNHSWDRKEILEFPAGMSPGCAGRKFSRKATLAAGLYAGTAKNGVKYAV